MWNYKFKLLHKCPCIPFKKKKRTGYFQCRSVGTGKTDKAELQPEDLNSKQQLWPILIVLCQNKMFKVFMTPFLITAFLSQHFDYLNNYLDQSGYLRVFYWTIMPILQIRRVRLGETKCLVLGHTAKRSWYWKPG